MFKDLGIARLKSPKEREKLITEGNGLYVRVTPKGKKTWLHYGKNRKWMKLGEYPDMSLKDAREKNAKYKLSTDKGINPAELKFSDDPTIKEFYQRWFDEGIDKSGNKWSELYKRNVEHIFKADVLPSIGGVKVRDVSKSLVAHLIQQVIDRGSTSQARQVYARLKRLLNYAAELDIIEISPMVSMPTKGTVKSRDRVLKDDEIKLFITNLPHLDMETTTARVLEFILRTGQRPSECSGINANEVEGNWWIIPGERTKNGLAHRVYLTDEAIKLIGTPGRNGYYFESYITGQPIHRNALSKALRRSISGTEKTQKDKTPTIKMNPFTPHDLRRTCATRLAEIGFNDDVIGAVLNHKKRSVTGIYNRHQYDNEKIKAMEAWSLKLSKIIGTKEPAKVVNIGGRS